MNEEQEKSQAQSQSNTQNEPQNQVSKIIQEIANSLNSLPERSKKETRIQKMLRLLKPSIEVAIIKGYTVKEIYDIVIKKGIKEIKESKLRSFVTQIRSEQKKKEQEAKRSKKKAD